MLRDTQNIESTFRFENVSSTQKHFSNIAHKYNGLRTTDPEVTSIISDYLTHYRFVKAVDIGCGDGRYMSELFRNLDGRLSLLSIDANYRMLKQFKKFLSLRYNRTCLALQGSACCLPLPDGMLEAVMTFNAVHHFSLKEFLYECCRVMRRNGYLFMYTRLRNQNKRTIWGKYFPKFYEKENRLYEHNKLVSSVTCTPGLDLKAVIPFQFERTSTLNILLHKAVNRHYSTFDFYEKDEFNNALESFKNNLIDNFSDINTIRWRDENIMVIAQKNLKVKMREQDRETPVIDRYTLTSS